MKPGKLPKMRIEVSVDAEQDWNAITLPYDPDTPFSVLPYDFLTLAKIRPQSLEEVKISGVIEDRNIGTAYFRYEDRVTESRVVFGHVDDTFTWGWHAVYYLGWELNPTTRKLQKANLDRPSPV